MTVKAVVEEESPKVAVPEVEVRLSAPVVNVRPEENLPVPTTSRATPGVEVPIPTLPWTMSPLFGADEPEPIA